MGEHVSKPYRYLEIQDRIQKDIQDLPPHSRLLSRIEMIKKYGVTRTTIEKAISELVGKGIVYNAIGSGTYVAERSAAAAPQASRMWGVVLPNITDDFYPEIVRGIQDMAQLHQAHVVLFNSDHQPEKQHRAVEQLIEAGLQGLIIVPAITKAATMRTYEQLQEQGIPFVFCNRAVEGIDAPKVVSNNFYGSFLATQYAIRQGYRRLAYIGGPMYSVLEQRVQGFLGAVQEAGIDVDPELVCITDDWDHQHIGREEATRLLRRSTGPDAIVCFNDTVASGVYQAAASAGLIVGSDIAVIGYGDTKLCETLPVKLTSIRYPAYRTGCNAADILVQAMNADSPSIPKSVILQPEIVVRSSCGENRP